VGARDAIQDPNIGCVHCGKFVGARRLASPSVGPCPSPRAVRASHTPYLPPLALFPGTAFDAHGAHLCASTTPRSGIARAPAQLSGLREPLTQPTCPFPVRSFMRMAPPGLSTMLRPSLFGSMQVRAREQ